MNALTFTIAFGEVFVFQHDENTDTTKKVNLYTDNEGKIHAIPEKFSYTSITKKQNKE